MDKPSIDTKILKERLAEAKKLGAKGLSFTGGGEPTMHPDYFEIIEYTKKIGFDNGTVTNGSTITSKNVDMLINNLQWIRFSVSGGDTQSYKLVQGVDQFDKILKNIQLLSDKKSELNSNLNIGIRTLVTPENIDTLVDFSNMIKDLNIDYYQLAPDQFTSDKGEFWNSDKTQGIFKQVNEILNDNKIKLLTTTFMNTQESLDVPRTCYAHFFMIGFPPISIIGFGLRCVSSLIRVPKPPAKITAFITNSLKLVYFNILYRKFQNKILILEIFLHST